MLAIGGVPQGNYAPAPWFQSSRGYAVHVSGHGNGMVQREVPELAREEYVGLEIPTLEEVLRRYRHRANYYIETKNPDNADAMEERLVALLDEYNLLRPAADRWQVLVQSFSPDSLLRLHALAPELPLIQLFSGSETSQTIQARLGWTPWRSTRWASAPPRTTWTPRWSRPRTLAAWTSTPTPSTKPRRCAR